MIINAIQPTYNKQPFFGAIERAVYKTETGGKILENLKLKNDTWAMRNFPSVDERANFIITKGIRHIYDFGCSNSIDTMCLLIALNERGGTDVLNKCCPIKAGDIDGAAQYYYENNKIFLEPFEIANIDDYTDGKFLRYFENDYTPDKLRAGYWRFKPYYRSKIDYSLNDVFEDYKKIEPNDSYIQVKDFWPYLEPEKRIVLAGNLLSRIGNNTHICIGEFDNRGYLEYTPMKDILPNLGFVPDSNSEYFYTKKG